MKSIVQIENNTHCNYSCWFCQNRYYVRPRKKVMDMDLFEHILKEVRKTYPVEEVNITSFSVYNEPTLDPLFLDRLSLMTEMEFDHLCAINGSNITKKLADSMVDSGFRYHSIVINLPTVDPTESRKIMGIPSAYHKKVLERLDYFFARLNDVEIPVRVNVNGNGTIDHKNTFHSIYTRFQHRKLEFSMVALHNRAGMLDHIIEGKIDKSPYDIFDCGMGYFKHLYVGIKGNVYLCCHDYYQKYSFGNLTEESLSNILESEKKKDMRIKFMSDFCKHCSYSIPKGVSSWIKA